jgi:hypothetical protein
MDRVYGAVAWQRVDQIRYNILNSKMIPKNEMFSEDVTALAEQTRDGAGRMTDTAKNIWERRPGLLRNLPCRIMSVIDAFRKHLAEELKFTYETRNVDSLWHDQPTAITRRSGLQTI